jgi:hypothetical protein
MENFKILFIIFLIFTSRYYAQPFNLKSVGEKKEFSLKIYYGTHGKGAFVQYNGQKGIIPLKIKSYKVDKSGREEHQPDFTSYVWDEIINGKINGTYYLTEGLREVFDIQYIRKKDNRIFKLILEDKDKKYDGVNQFLLNGALISYNTFADNHLSIKYSEKNLFKAELPGFDHPDYSRQGVINDYNFDGFDDLAFSIPDGGMGVYRIFTVYIYDPKTKKFEKLIEPDFSKSKCECLCNLAIHKSEKMISSECRGGARWWKDIYKYKKGKLVWVRSQETVD